MFQITNAEVVMFHVHLIGGHYILQEKCLWVWQFMLMKKTVMSMLRLHHHCRYYNVVIVVIYILVLVVNHSNFLCLSVDACCNYLKGKKIIVF